MPCARSGWERPAKTISRFCGPRSIQCPGFTSGRSAAGSKPGSRASSAVALPIDITLLRLLARREAGERARRNILGDDSARIDPCVVAYVDGSDERIVDTGSDVAPDRRPALGSIRLVRVVRGDVPGADVGVLTHLGVAHVREMRHLRARADTRVLDLHE